MKKRYTLQARRLRGTLWRAGVWGAVVVVLGLLIGAERAGWLGAMLAKQGAALARREVDLRRWQGRVVKVRTVGDGPRFTCIDANGHKLSLRLLGVTHDSQRPRTHAAASARQLIADKPVHITLDPAMTRDAKGRLRGDLTLADQTSLTERLLLAGQLRVSDVTHERAEHFRLLQRQAKFDEVGMWAEAMTTPDND